MKKKTENSSRRFTVLDGIIILVILAVIGVGIYLIISDKAPATAETTVPITFTIELKGLKDAYAGNIHVGDTVIDSVTKKTIGTVASVETLPHTEYIVNQENGVIEEKAYPGQATVLLTVSGDAVLGGLGYTIDGYRVAIGVLHHLQLPHFLGSGYCIGVQAQS